MRGGVLEPRQAGVIDCAHALARFPALLSASHPVSLHVCVCVCLTAFFPDSLSRPRLPAHHACLPPYCARALLCTLHSVRAACLCVAAEALLHSASHSDRPLAKCGTMLPWTYTETSK